MTRAQADGECAANSIGLVNLVVLRDTGGTETVMAVPVYYDEITACVAYKKDPSRVRAYMTESDRFIFDTIRAMKREADQRAYAAMDDMK